MVRTNWPSLRGRLPTTPCVECVQEWAMRGSAVCFFCYEKQSERAEKLWAITRPQEDDNILICSIPDPPTD